ncbi:MAG: SCP2 sterol-binding domain-containing protein [Desulfosudaceae bacterium]
MASPTFTITVDVDTLMTEFIPKLARQFMALQNTADQLEGTSLTLTVDISGSRYSYSITGGRDFEASRGELDNPMVFLSIPLESLARLADMENIDMLLGMQSQLTREKHAILSGLKGTCKYVMTHPDGEETTITAVFNGADTPAATFKLALEDARDLTARRESPIQLFMNGKLQIDGEMAFAMTLQPLFS